MIVEKIPIENKSINGISYLHFSLPLIEDINEGILIESIITKIE